MEQDEVFLAVVLSFVLGVAAGSFFTVALPLLFLGSAVLLAVSVVFQSRLFFTLAACVLILCAGAELVQVKRSMFLALQAPKGETVGVVRVLTDPEERDFFQKTLVRFESCETAPCPKTKLLWQAPLSFRERAGTRLHFQCQLEIPKNFDGAFDYRLFLAKDDIGYVCTEAGVSVLPGDWAGRMRSALYAPKRVFEAALSRIIPEPEAGLAKGLLLGGDQYLPRELKESFTRVGLSHMIAVSGYNITIIAELVLTLGLLLGLWRKQAVWTALVGIVFFILMIGMPASAARAGTMAGIVFLAFQTGRLARPTHVLLFAGGVMLLFHPLLLRYDLGFQLSFLATLGILLLVPYYERIAPKHWLLAKGGEILAMTLAAELFVLPIILYSFHLFSPLILIGNFLVLLVPLAMALAFLSALLSLVLPGGETVVAWLAFAVLTMITRSVEWLGSFTQASIAVPTFEVRHLVLWYVILGGGLFFGSRYISGRRYEKVA